jgi:hypothetical protein
MSARHCDRISLVVPVEVVLQDESGRRTVAATTVDASAYGARLANFQEGVAIAVGQTVTIFYRSRHCNFRVAWIGKVGTAHESHIGLESLDSSKNLWGIDFQDSQPTLEPDFQIFPWETDKAS